MSVRPHLDHDVVAGSRFLCFIHPTLHHIVAHFHHVLNTHTHKQKGLYYTADIQIHSYATLKRSFWIYNENVNLCHLFTSEETRAELDTLGTLSTIACFMYLSMACSMVVCGGGREHLDF